MPEIISRKEARDRGLKRFFTGIACSNGHVCEGWVAGASCLECFYAKQAEAYYRNHEVRKANNRRYAKKHRKEALARWKRWKGKNLEHAKMMARLQARKDRKKNPSKWRDYYENGPKNPKDEMQWLRKNRAQLLSVKRHLRDRRREQSQSSQAET